MSDSALSECAADRSVLVVAHPDDEILWFGSIAADVDSIIVCFLHDPSHPELAESRRRTLAQHPWSDRIRCLALPETGAFGHAAWPLPETSAAGLRISGSRQIARTYRRRAGELRRALAPFIADAANVFTHNPWGEYGHEEHVLVHRVTTGLAAEHGVAVHYSNYASSWSMALMLRYLARTATRNLSGNVDTAQMREISAVYRANGAWTWFDNYTWFDTEYYVSGPLEEKQDTDFGWLFPVNFVNLPDRAPTHRPSPALVRAARRYWRHIRSRGNKDA